MPTERENMFAPLHFVDYDIAGNSLRAYYDLDNRLIFVLDNTIGQYKPNVLLVIGADSDRKWDDILANDYGMDLETVRPKKNNKYQKLDIEYDGLDIYDELIRGYNDATNFTDVLVRLENYRADAARNSANERLIAAEDTAAKSRETIAKTQDSIEEIQARIKRLRAQLAQYKSKIGKEPTKQSAAKILRTESQIEMAGVKLSRARRRLDKAKKRLAAAADEADAAREILALLDARRPVDMPEKKSRPASSALAVSQPREVMVVNDDDEDDDDDTDDDYEEEMDEEYDEPDNDADDDVIVTPAADESDVKPLFSRDPQILDDEIAFKPIEFGAPSFAASDVSLDAESDSNNVSDDVTIAPLSFTPPVSAASTPAPAEQVENKTEFAPVLDTITSVSTPDEDIVVAQQQIETPAPMPATSPDVLPDVAPAPVASDFRPVSPVAAAPVAPVDGGDTPRKPTVLYYMMLIILIVLSIFTLWMYQRSTSTTVPDLTSVVENEVDDTPAVVEDTVVVSENPFIDLEPVSVAEPVPEPVVEPVVVATPEPEIVSEPEPEPQVVAQPEPEIVPEPEPEPVVVTEAETFVAFDEEPDAAAEEERIIATEDEVIASKPAYNVSQQEKMFVADDDYIVDDMDAPVCSDGMAPDMYGCCTGEAYTELPGQGMACCDELTGDCYPPMEL